MKEYSCAPAIEYGDEKFYTYAMELFRKAGHVAVSEPEFANHSPEQFLYFDNKRDASFSREQRAMFRAFRNISRLFSANGCAFFSMNLLTARNDRSQAAHDIHTMISPIIESNSTVCLFYDGDNVMLSFMGYGFRCILSDWYPINDDYERLLDKLDISNISIQSGYGYFLDMLYILARNYYFLGKPLNYELFPVNFLFSERFHELDREELNQLIEYELTASQREYGDDYVEYDEFVRHRPVDIGAELELMLLEMDAESDNPLGEEMTDDEDLSEEREFLDEDAERTDRLEWDDYELNDVDPEIFRDPALMVKWLKKMEQKS